MLTAVHAMQLLHQGIAKFNEYDINTKRDFYYTAFTSLPTFQICCRNMLMLTNICVCCAAAA